MLNALAWMGLLGFGGTLMAAAPSVLVLDASGSMWGQLQGQSKMQIAQSAVREALAQWPQERALGLIAYGHRSKTDCADIETLAPVAAFDGARLTKAVDALRPNGMTPIGASLRAAFKLMPADAGGTVILVSDGEETCDVDPCAIAREIKRANALVLVHVVGFDVSASPARKQLTCVAEGTGGRYFDARDAKGLARAMSAAVFSTTRGPVAASRADIDWKGVVPLASVIAVTWRGPGDSLDYLAFAEPGSPEDSYVGSAFSDTLVAGKPANVRTPATPGKFELRYVSPTRQPQVLGRVSVEAAASDVRIEAADSVLAGDRIRVRASGPVGDHHWIGVAPRGAPIETVLSFARIDASGVSDVELTMPGEPGAYEIRYVLNERESIAGTRAITVVRSVASFGKLPQSFTASGSVAIAYDGPRGEGNWIGFVRRGADSSDYATFAYVPAAGPVEFFAPPDVGDYDLVLVMPVDGSDQIKLREPVQVR